MRREVLIGGEGGQGIRLVGLLFARICAAEGRSVAGSASYGAEKRGSKCWSEIVVSDEPIDYPKVLEADIMASMMQETYDFLLPRLRSDARVLYDPLLVPSPRHSGSAKIMEIRAVEHALKYFNDEHLANIILLGAVVSVSSLASKESGAKIVKNHVTRPRALEAFEHGYALGKESAI